MKNVLVLSSSLKGTLVASGVYEKGAIKETKFLDKAYKMGLKVSED